MLSTVNELQLFIIWYIYSIYIYIRIYISTYIIYIYIYIIYIYIIYIYIHNILHNTNDTNHYFTPKLLNLYFYANFIRIFLYTFIQNNFIYNICTITQSKFATINYMRLERNRHVRPSTFNHWL